MMAFFFLSFLFYLQSNKEQLGSYGWKKKLSSELPCKLDAVVVKTDLCNSGSGECVCLVNLIKQQVQKSGHMALMCPVRG